MGENLKIPGRRSVRTPMQWTPHRDGGFSTADPSEFRDPMTEGEYGPERVNVSAQRRDGGSLLHFIGGLVETYRECPELAWGEYEVLDGGADPVLAHRCDLDGGTMLIVHNLAGRPVEAEVTLDGLDDSTVLTDLMVDGTIELSPSGRARIALDPYGYRWFRASAPERAPAGAAAARHASRG